MMLQNNCDSIKNLSQLCKVSRTTIYKILSKRDLKLAELLQSDKAVELQVTLL